MDVNGINNNYQPPVTTTTAVQEDVKNEVNNNVTASSASDNKSTAAVYDKSSVKNYKVDLGSVQDAIDEANNQGKRLQVLVEKLLNKQGNQALKANGFQLTKDFFEKLQVDDATRKQAQEDISEDGYYGVKQTSKRLLDFAKGISGGDPSKIEILKGAVLKGFENAERAWGDKLPEISQQTKEAVLQGFDEWEASFK